MRFTQAPAYAWCWYKITMGSALAGATVAPQHPALPSTASCITILPLQTGGNLFHKINES